MFLAAGRNSAPGGTPASRAVATDMLTGGGGGQPNSVPPTPSTPDVLVGTTSSPNSLNRGNTVNKVKSMFGRAPTNIGPTAFIPKSYGMAHGQWNLNGLADGIAFCGPLHKFVTHRAFQPCINLVILCNAVQMGLAADFKGGHWDDIWETCEHVFTVILVVEVLLKMLAFGPSFFRSHWNQLDVFVAVVSIADRWLFNVFFRKQAGILQALRLARLLRMLKLFKMVPELAMVVEGLAGSIRSMFWVFMLLAMVLYAFGICCVEIIGNPDAGYPGREEVQAEIDAAVLEEFNSYIYFGSLMRAMVSLFSVTLLAEWTPIMRPIWEKQASMVVVFIALVVLTTFGILNVIVGVVVERTMAQMNQLREKDAERLREQQMKAFEKISDIMFELDTDGDKRISASEMNQACENDHLRAMLETVDLPHGMSFLEFHEMLDLDGSGWLSKNEFIHGMLRLVFNDQFQRDCTSQLSIGKLRSLNMNLQRELKAEMRKEMGRLRNEFRALRSEISQLTGGQVSYRLVEDTAGLSSRATSAATSVIASQPLNYGGSEQEASPEEEEDVPAPLSPTSPTRVAAAAKTGITTGPMVAGEWHPLPRKDSAVEAAPSSVTDGSTARFGSSQSRTSSTLLLAAGSQRADPGSLLARRGLRLSEEGPVTPLDNIRDLLDATSGGAVAGTCPIGGDDVDIAAACDLAADCGILPPPDLLDNVFQQNGLLAHHELAGGHV